MEKGVKRFWKSNDITNKISIVSEREAMIDKDNCMFELVEELSYSPEPVKKEIIAPSPTIEEKEEDTNNSQKMSEDLEKLELDIREAQHEQNLKLMNIMLDVNKFKLHDLSMSNYLKTCTRNSGNDLSNEVSETVINSLLRNNQLNNSEGNNNLKIILIIQII